MSIKNKLRYYRQKTRKWAIGIFVKFKEVSLTDEEKQEMKQNIIKKIKEDDR